MTAAEFKQTLSEFLEKNDYQALQDVCEQQHPALVADVLSMFIQEDANYEQADTILSNLTPELCSGIISYLDEEHQKEIAELTSYYRLAQILSHMDPDDRVDLLRILPEERQERLMRTFGQSDREEIERLSAHPERTAGAVMTPDYITLSPKTRVGNAIFAIRQQADDKETIYYCYIVDSDKRLIGFVSLKDLIIAPTNALVESIMRTNIVYAKVTDDQEAAARKIDKYDLLALPVVDKDMHLRGIITHDDAIDILNQELTEDMEKFMAITGSHKTGAYLATSSWVHFKKRAPWIIGLAFVGLLSGLIIHSFEDAISALIILAFYMPMIADTGGNTGSQSATVVVRALALGEISLADALKVLLKEFKISIMLAGILAIIAYAKVYILSYALELPSGFDLSTIGIVVALALGLQVVTATLIGAVLPLIAKSFKLDPAVVASPALTTVVDITGLLIYFTIAMWLLNI